MTWPDIAIAVIVLIGALNGWKRGFVGELTGMLALGFAISAAFTYAGSWDGAIAAKLHLGPGSAHVVCMVLYAALAYAIVRAIGAALATVTRLPIVGTLNAGLGATVGGLKAVTFLWAIIYIALFFPLSQDLRDDLGRSKAIAFLQRPNGALDHRLRTSLPWYVRPFSGSLFARHRV